MAEVNVPKISQGDTIKDAAGKVLPESQQNAIREHLKSSDLMTEDGKASEDVIGVFQKASKAVCIHHFPFGRNLADAKS